MWRWNMQKPGSVRSNDSGEPVINSSDPRKSRAMSATARMGSAIGHILSIRIVPRTHDSDAKELEKCAVLVTHN